MIHNSKILRLIIYTGLAAAPSVLHASEYNFCGPKAQEECLAQLSPNVCSEIKRACKKRQSVPEVHRMPPSTNTVDAAYKSSTASEQPLDNPGPPTQYVFIRADKLDNPYPGLSISAGQALGASVNFTRNDFVQSKVKTVAGSSVVVSSSESVTISGLASFAFINPESDFGWNIGTLTDQSVYMVPSLWVSGSGNWDQPTKPFGDTSAVKAGGELDFLLFPSAVQNTANYWMTYVGISPFPSRKRVPAVQVAAWR